MHHYYFVLYSKKFIDLVAAAPLLRFAGIVINTGGEGGGNWKGKILRTWVHCYPFREKYTPWAEEICVHECRRKLLGKEVREIVSNSSPDMVMVVMIRIQNRSYVINLCHVF